MVAGAQLSGCNLGALNLTGLDLTGIDLRGAYIAGVDLTSANLTNANLTNANLTEAGSQPFNGRGEPWCDPDTNSNLVADGYRSVRTDAGTDFTGAQFTDNEFRGLDFRTGNFTNAVLDNLNSPWWGCLSMAGGTFHSTTFVRWAQQNMDMTGADSSGSIWVHPYLCQADMSGADFRDADLTGAIFEDVDLSLADFNGAITTNVTSSAPTWANDWQQTDFGTGGWAGSTWTDQQDFDGAACPDGSTGSSANPCFVTTP